MEKNTRIMISTLTLEIQEAIKKIKSSSLGSFFLDCSKYDPERDIVKAYVKETSIVITTEIPPVYIKDTAPEDFLSGIVRRYLRYIQSRVPPLLNIGDYCMSTGNEGPVYVEGVSPLEPSNCLDYNFHEMDPYLYCFKYCTRTGRKITSSSNVWKIDTMEMLNFMLTIIHKDSLIGELEHVSLNVVKDMMKNQILQRKLPQIALFQENFLHEKGFNWERSLEGEDYWKNIYLKYVKPYILNKKDYGSGKLFNESGVLCDRMSGQEILPVKLQGEKLTILRGDVPEGHFVRYQRSKSSVEPGRVSNREVLG